MGLHIPLFFSRGLSSMQQFWKSPHRFSFLKGTTRQNLYFTITGVTSKNGSKSDRPQFLSK